MQRMKLIYNPTAGNESFSYHLTEVLNTFKSQGIEALPFPTRGKGDGKLLSYTAKEEGYDLIGVAGGDGTINEVINGIAHEADPLPVGIFPAGTANDFAKMLKIPQNFTRCCSIISNNFTHAIDIGQVQEQYFINVAAGGLLTDIPYKVSSEAKTLFGKMAYYIKGLGEIPKFRFFDLNIQYDKGEINEKVMLFVITNGNTIGGFSRIAPEAKVDDGLLDVYLVKQILWKDIPDLFLRFINRTHHQHPSIEHFQTQELKLFCTDEQIHIDLDGEMGPRLPVVFRVLPKKIKIFVPE